MTKPIIDGICRDCGGAISPEATGKVLPELGCVHAHKDVCIAILRAEVAVLRELIKLNRDGLNRALARKAVAG